jgi:hypothetical protein
MEFEAPNANSLPTAARLPGQLLALLALLCAGRCGAPA